jgi:arginyl-tRNA synthetase
VTPAVLAELVRSAAHDVLTSHGLDPDALPATVTLRRPRDPGHGHYATTVALPAARKTGVEPRELAGWLAKELTQRTGVRSVQVAGPGFLNLWLGTEAQAEIVAQVLASGRSFGTGQELAEQRIEATAEALISQQASLADFVAAVGTDAARYALIRSAGASPISIDPERWSKRTDDNPVFHVQYAHARLASLARNAADLGISSTDAQLGLLDHEWEGALIRTLGEFPQIVTEAAQLREPHRLTRYLEELASSSHQLTGVLPMGEEPPDQRHAARLALCEATRQVLVNGLDLLGISAPERM